MNYVVEGQTRLRAELFVTALVIFGLAAFGPEMRESAVTLILPLASIPRGPLFVGLYLFFLYVLRCLWVKQALSLDRAKQLLDRYDAMKGQMETLVGETLNIDLSDHIPKQSIQAVLTEHFTRLEMKWPGGIANFNSNLAAMEETIPTLPDRIADSVQRNIGGAADRHTQSVLKAVQALIERTREGLQTYHQALATEGREMHRLLVAIRDEAQALDAKTADIRDELVNHSKKTVDIAGQLITQLKAFLTEVRAVRSLMGQDLNLNAFWIPVVASVLLVVFALPLAWPDIGDASQWQFMLRWLEAIPRFGL